MPSRFKVPVFEMLRFTHFCVARKSAQEYTEISKSSNLPESS